MSSYQLEIDGGPAEAGSERIVKSFESIKAAADRMEGSIVESAKKMVAAFSQLSNVRTVSREAIDSLNSLSSSLSKYRGPSKVSVENTNAFLTMLRGFSGFKAPSAAGMDRFLNSMNKFSGPTPGAGKNTKSLLDALRGFTGITGAGARVSAFLTALGGFRGPSANAGRNTERLFAAIGTFTGLPRGFANAATQFVEFAAAVDRATAAFQRLRAASSGRIEAPVAPSVRGPTAGGGGGLQLTDNSRAVARNSAAIRRLGDDHSFLATSVLRTQTALNALGGVFAAKEIIGAANDILKINAQLTAATGSASVARTQMAYLQETTQRLGISLVETSRSYGLFLGSVKGTNVSVAEAQRIFEGFATAGRALQLSTSDMDGVFRALGQIISKGKLQAEELRGQLGDRLPGAFVRMAAALKVTPQQLDDLMKKGLISGKRLEEGLLNMADSLKIEFAGAAVLASKTVDAAFNRTKNAFVNAAAGLGASGLNEGLINIADAMTALINSRGLANFLSVIGGGFKFLGENIETVVSILEGAAIAYMLKYITTLVSGAKALGTITLATEAYTIASKASTAAAVSAGLANAAAVGTITTTAATVGTLTNVTQIAATATNAQSLALGAAAGSFNKYSSAIKVSNYAVGTGSKIAVDASSAVSGLSSSIGGITSAVGAQTVATNAAATSMGVYTLGTQSVAGAAAEQTVSTRAAAGSFGQYTVAANSAGAAAAGTVGGISASATAASAQGTAAYGAATSLGTYGTAVGGVGAANAATVAPVTAATEALGAEALAAEAAAGGLGGYTLAVDAATAATAGVTVPVTAGTAAISAQGVASGITAGGLGALGIASEATVVSSNTLTGAVTTSTGAVAAQGVASVITGGAVTGLAGATTGLSGAMTITIAPTVAATAATTAYGIASGLATRATAVFMGATRALYAVIAANPFALLAIALAAAVVWYNTLEDKQAAANKVMDESNRFSAEGANLIAFLNERIDGNIKKLNEQSQAYREQRLAILERNQALLVDTPTNLVKYGEVGGFNTPLGRARGIVNPSAGGDKLGVRTGLGRIEELDANFARGIAGAVEDAPGTNGGVKPKQVITAADYKRLLLATNYVNANSRDNRTPGTGFRGDASLNAAKEFVKNASAQINFIHAQGDTKGNKLQFDYKAVEKDVFKYDAAAAAAAKKDTPDDPKKVKPDKAAAARARQDEADLRRALEGVRDVRREIAGSYDAVEAFSKSSVDGIAQASRAVAVAKLDNIEDSYGSIERAQAGVVKFAGLLRDQAKETLDAVNAAQATVAKADTDPASVSADSLADAKKLIAHTTQSEIDAANALLAANVSTYRGSRAASEEYLAGVERSKEQVKALADATADLTAKREDVARRTGGDENVQGKDMVEATLRGGKALQQAAIYNDAYKDSLKLAESDRAKFIQDTVDAETKLRDLNRALEVAAQLNSEALNAKNIGDTAKLYTSGLNPRDIEYYRELIELQNTSQNSGDSNAQTNALVARRQAVLDLTRSFEDLQKTQESIRQLSQDQADAIVDGFKKAAESGQSFSKTMKGIFSDLKNILLDFVLYNPLKEFLADTFTGSNSKRFGNQQQTQNTVAQAQNISATDSLTNVADLFSSFGSGSSQSGQSSQSSSSGFFGGASKAQITSFGKGVGAASAPIITSGVTAAGEITGDIVVTAQKQNTEVLQQVAQTASNPDRFAALKKVFDFKGNQKLFGDGFKTIGDSFSKAGGITKNLKSFGDGLGQVAQAAGNAFAAYSTGKTVAKSLGIKGAGAEAIGGAAAGYSIGGPVGAAVGGAIGLAKGLLFKKKTPSAYVNVSVGADGTASAGTASKYGKGDVKAAEAQGTAAAGFLNDFANQFNAILGAGQYGTFGKRKDKEFYSATGQVKKGKPKGVEGVDYIYGTDSELQAFALKSNIKAGRVELPTESLKTVAANTKATTTEALYADFNVAKSFDDFLKGSFKTSDAQKQVLQLNDAFDALKRQSVALGLSESKLRAARDRMLATMTSEFNFSVSQGILSLTDPIMAEFNELQADYKNSVSDAIAVGGNLADVEKYYGLQRAELVKKYAEQANDSVRTAAKDLLTSLTATSSSPLAATTVLTNAQDEYTTLRGQFDSGDYTNIDKLGAATQNYLSAAQEVFASSSDYFNIFRDVTSYLKTMSETAVVAGTGTSPDDLPELTSLDSLVAEVQAANKALADVTKSVGVAVTETGAETTDLLGTIAAQGADLNALIAAGLNLTGISAGQSSSGGLRTVAETSALF